MSEAIAEQEVAFERLRAACIADHPSVETSQGWLPRMWKCRLCEQYGFKGRYSIEHSADCAMAGDKP